jgi:hypothetical protein
MTTISRDEFKRACDNYIKSLKTKDKGNNTILPRGCKSTFSNGSTTYHWNNGSPYVIRNSRGYNQDFGIDFRNLNESRRRTYISVSAFESACRRSGNNTDDKINIFKPIRR